MFLCGRGTKQLFETIISKSTDSRNFAFSEVLGGLASECLRKSEMMGTFRWRDVLKSPDFSVCYRAQRIMYVLPFKALGDEF